jgi:hypothetical protein
MTVKFNDKKNTFSINGYAMEFMNIISKSLNFTYVYNPAKFVRDNVIEFNKSLSIDLKVEVGSYRNNFMKHKAPARVTEGYTTVDEIIIISQFAPYSSFEKIFLPFEIELWWWLIGSLIVMYVTSALIIVFAPESARHFIYGLKVKSPLMNMV